MRLSNHVEPLAEAVYSAINLHLPAISYDARTVIERRNPESEPRTGLRRPRVDEVEAFHFPQVWGSTALGFGGMGGSAMTKAYTTVVVCGQYASVFFDGRHCYSVKCNTALFEDIKAQRIADFSEKGRYE